ncbi:OmpL47-type beta-barrel domain-containing protein [Streptomyces geranii]|uniref:OmpL47-type beta-barrel domain-containing protein n=1 Tax=Streptomyces geranii TaxID=2058923 RepID=UPI000D041ED6|nr:family 16 glycoside hydrolase [Streptomyces geranii]
MTRGRRHLWTALLASLLLVLGLTSAAGARTAAEPVADEPAAAQVLTWTAGDDITKYSSAPTTAVAGATTIVFENSAATGNTMGMPHTLTFDVVDPEYNNDVPLNILANPNDDQDGRHTAEVTLAPGRYRYFCTIPGHGQMQGILVVTEGGGSDTTAPVTSVNVTGAQNSQGQYVGSASVAIGATDEGSGVDRVEYAIGADGAWQPYTTPVVIDQVGGHTVRYRAFDKTGNAAAEKSVTFTVVAPPTEDTAPPETSATVSGERNPDGAYLDMATVTVSASDTGSGVNTVEYAVNGGSWQPYTGPVMVHQVGSHTVRYRATDKAGNVAAEKSVAFTVVAQPAEDTTPPVTGVTVEGTRNANGAYVNSAKVTISATDPHGGSGVAVVEYSLDGGPYLTYTAPVLVDRAGAHSVTYRASDKAGNTSEARSVSLTVVAGGGVPAPNCPEYDERLTVIVGTVDSGVPNRVTNNRCRIGELIEDEREWTSHALFLKHVRTVLDQLFKDGAIDEREDAAIDEAARESGIGRPGQTEGYRTILDGTAASFAKWQQVGGGSFARNGDGSITSGTTVGGLGMLWFPERKYGDFSLKLQWRDDAPGTGNANSGVFVRFPWVQGHPEEPRPEWVAIKYGHEVQVLDRPDGDMYKTGSVYGFDRVGLAGAGVTQKGTWNDYEIRVVDQHYSVYRNGVLINEFDNIGGQDFTPPRSDDPGTDGRRFASGYIGLQVHGTTDVVSYRDIRIKDL